VKNQIIFTVIFLAVLIYARERQLSDREIGAKWCKARGLMLSSADIGRTERPPYLTGEFKPKTKLTIICKKSLH